jgi:hypothetical protein
VFSLVQRSSRTLISLEQQLSLLLVRRCSGVQGDYILVTTLHTRGVGAQECSDLPAAVPYQQPICIGRLFVPASVEERVVGGNLDHGFGCGKWSLLFFTEIVWG